jgi:hypothetical protein
MSCLVGHNCVDTTTAAPGVTRQRMRAEPALIQRLGRSHQHDAGCDSEAETGSRPDFPQSP